MANLQAQGNQQLNQKLQLEVGIGFALLRWFNKIIPEIKKQYIDNGQPLDFQAYQGSLSLILLNFYNKVTRKVGNKSFANFQAQINRLDLESYPSKMTAKERDDFYMSLSSLLLARSVVQANLILGTLQERLNRAISDSRTKIPTATNSKIINDALKTYRPQQRAHLKQMVALDQTQYTYEDIKFEGVQYMLSRDITNQLAAVKTWITRNDDRVRPAHAAAAGQTVPSNDRFIVMGEELIYPRDPNGSLPNILGCRCSAIYTFKKL